jgi:arsenite methyltransferase
MTVEECYSQNLITDMEILRDSVNPEKWCSCIEDVLTKKNYLDSIRKAEFKNVGVLQEKAYVDDQADNDEKDSRRIISCLIIKAVKK